MEDDVACLIDPVNRDIRHMFSEKTRFCADIELGVSCSQMPEAIQTPNALVHNQCGPRGVRGMFAVSVSESRMVISALESPLALWDGATPLLLLS